MTSRSRNHGRGIEGEAEPVTDRIHDNSWSANFEKPEHAAGSTFPDGVDDASTGAGPEDSG